MCRIYIFKRFYLILRDKIKYYQKHSIRVKDLMLCFFERGRIYLFVINMKAIPIVTDLL